MIVKNVTNDLSSMRLDKATAEMFTDYSRTQIKKWIEEGRVLINGEVSQPRDKVYENDQIELSPKEEQKVSWEAQDIDFEIHFENEDFIIINKPAGLIMHPGSGCYDGTLANGLLYKFPELINIPRSGIVHRLDKDTSGILLVARNESFRNFFINEMQERRVVKKYTSIVIGSTLGSFSIDEPIGRDKNNRTKMAIREDGKDALTFVKLKENIGNYSVLDIRIETGRTHQIRVHLSSKKLPIIGDKTYDPSRSIARDTPEELINIIRGFPRQALHATHLSFNDQKTNNIFSFDIPTPNDMEELLQELRKFI